MFPVLSPSLNNRGVAIVAVTMVMVVAALLGGAIITQTTQDVQLTDRTYEDKQALYLAESAKERGYQEILNDINFTATGNPGTLANVTMQGGTYDLVATTLSTSPIVVQMVATGETGETDRRVTVVAEVVRENVCVWNNAIFGGSGQTGRVTRGDRASLSVVDLA